MLIESALIRERLSLFFDETLALGDAVETLRGMVRGAPQSALAPISISFHSFWNQQHSEYHMFDPSCVLLRIGSDFVEGLPDANALCKPILCQEFCDRLDIFLKYEYCPEHPEQYDELHALARRLRHSLVADKPAEVRAVSSIYHIFYISISATLASHGTTFSDADIPAVLEYLVKAARCGFGAPVGITFGFEVTGTDPTVYPTARRPAFVTMTAVCPGDPVPDDERARLREQHREFCDRMGSYLVESYGPSNPAKADAAQAALAQLRGVLGV